MKLKKFLVWLPRVLATAFALFLALFALDTPLSLGFFIHLAPSAIILLATFFAWKFPKIGGIIFLALGIFATFFFNGFESWQQFLFVVFPFLLVGGLFLIPQKDE